VSLRGSHGRVADDRHHPVLQLRRLLAGEGQDGLGFGQVLHLKDGGVPEGMYQPHLLDLHQGRRGRKDLLFEVHRRAAARKEGQLLVADALVEQFGDVPVGEQQVLADDEGCAAIREARESEDLDPADGADGVLDLGAMLGQVLPRRRRIVEGVVEDVVDRPQVRKDERLDTADVGAGGFEATNQPAVSLLCLGRQGLGHVGHGAESPRLAFLFDQSA
jgi:hypothetical protein